MHNSKKCGVHSVIVSTWYDILFFRVLLCLFVCGRFNRTKHIRSHKDNKSNHGRLYVEELES